AERLDRRRHSFDVAVVVGAPDVDQLIVTALELLAMIADVRGEVRQLAVAALNDPILFVAERGRAEPRRTVRVVDVTALLQRPYGAADHAFIMELALADE